MVWLLAFLGPAGGGLGGGSKFGFWLFQPRQVAGRNLAFGFFEPRNHIKYPIFHHFYPIFPIFLLYFAYFHINIPYI